MVGEIIFQSHPDLGRVHIDTSTGPGTRTRVHGNKKIQCNPMAAVHIVRVVYVSELPVNSTRTSRICTGHVSREPVQADYAK